MSTSDESLKETGRCAAAAIVEMVAALECDYDRLEALRDGGELPEDSKLLLDDHRGVYIPRDFAREMKRECVLNVTPADFDELERGPDVEGYWDLWQEVLDAAEIIEPETGKHYRLYQDGAVWMIPLDSELTRLESAAGECTSREEAETRIQEDALSVLVRTGWYEPTSSGTAHEPEEFEILLSTGGPASRIRGELTDGEPCRAWLEVQDWGTPWTEYRGTVSKDDPGKLENQIDQDTLLAYARCFYYGESS